MIITFSYFVIALWSRYVSEKYKKRNILDFKIQKVGIRSDQAKITDWQPKWCFRNWWFTLVLLFTFTTVFPTIPIQPQYYKTHLFSTEKASSLSATLPKPETKKPERGLKVTSHSSFSKFEEKRHRQSETLKKANLLKFSVFKKSNTGYLILI